MTELGTRTADYDYDLPDDRIASHPAAQRDGSRLLVLPPGDAPFRHLAFPDLLELIQPGDLLVVNESRVLPARLQGHRSTGGKAEVLLLTPEEGDPPTVWSALVRPGRKVKRGDRVTIGEGLEIEAIDEHDPQGDGVRRVRLLTELDPIEAVHTHGSLPLPPYLGREAEPSDRERYQTVFARVPGSVAAPTAGLHFTPELLDQLTARGVERTEVTLHVGAGTFRPVEVDDPESHVMHAESWEVSEATVAAVRRCREAGGRVWAVGTTVVRTLESAVDEAGALQPGRGSTRLFIRPPYRFHVVDALLTNFHLPRSTLMMLVAAFAGYERTLAAYRAAIEKGYRFYSYGDAMLILPRESR